MSMIRDDFSFGVLLHMFRQRQHLTQQELAEALGMHRRTLIRWEQGDYLPESRTMVLELARHLHLNDQETRQLLEGSLTALVPHWLVSLPRNPYFTGREEMLNDLYRQLKIEQTVALTQSSALHGLGGVGKTQIALEYAYRYVLEYSAVFWIGAETDEQVIASLLHIAEKLQLPEQEDNDQQRVVAAVQRWLSTHGQWLLIWDNVEDLNILQRFLPAVRSGAILLTTRRQTLGTHARGLDLLPMEQEEGLLFLLRRAKVLSPEETSEHVRQLAIQAPAQYAAASELVTVLGGLPLALDQAGAYLEETRCGLPAYLDLFRTRREALLHRRGEGIQDHPASVSTTFTLAITAVAERYSAVMDLLQVCALLQPDAIPEEIFLQGEGYLGATLQAVCLDPLEWDRVVSVASRYSLLSRQPEERTLSLHRLVQAVLLDTMTEAEKEQYNTRVIAALNAVFPEIRAMTQDAAYKQGKRLLPHTLLCLHGIKKPSEPLTLASLAYKAALYLRECGRYTEAEPLYLRVLHILEQQLGAEYPGVATALNNLGLLYWNQGRYTETEPLYLRALHILELSRGPGHLEVARPLHNLAILYCQQGKYSEAEPLYLRALHIKEQQLGAEHLETTLPLSSLAELYCLQGRYAEAELLYLRTLHIRERQLEAEHPSVAIALNNLADFYQQQGKYVEAEPLYQHALYIFEQRLGLEHPYVAQTLHGLANLAQSQGKPAEAEALYRRVLSLREQHFSQPHPEIAEVLHDFAVFCQKQGNLDEARALAERALNIRTQSLGDTHPKTVATRVLSAHLMQEHVCRGSEAASERCPRAIPNPRENKRHEEDASSPLLKAVTSAPSEDNPLQAFLDTCCELDPRAWCRSADLWQAYVCWVEEHQERFPLLRGAFIAQLKAHGCRTDRTKRSRIWRGIALINKNDDGG